MKFRYPLLFALTFCTFFINAQQAKFKQLLAMELNEMLKVEVATGTSKQLSEAPAVVSVVTAEQIQNSGARTLAEAVERVPGLHVMSSAFRMQSLYAIRGIHSTTTPQILILLDGTSISEMASWASPIGFRYPVNAIERIEIIRGPGSAVYGADAFSGVINIVTKKFSDITEMNAGVKAGNFSYREAWLNAYTQFDELLVGLSVTSEQMGNDPDRTTQYGVLHRERDMNNLHFNVKYQDFELRNWYWDVTQFMGIGASLVGNDIDFDKSHASKTQLIWDTDLTEFIHASVDIAHTQHQSEAYFQLFPPGTWPLGSDGNVFGAPFTPVEFPNGVIGNPGATTKKNIINSSLILTSIEDHRIRIGIGAETQDLQDVIETKNFGPGVTDEANRDPSGIADLVVDVTGTEHIYTPAYDRNLWYVSLQDEWHINDQWELTAGLRHDYYSDFGATTNPRIALVWNTFEELTTKFLYGTAFRAPKVSQLAYINNPATLGNPNIKPETISMAELVMHYAPSEYVSLNSNLFSYKTKDLIQLDDSFVHQNIGEQEGQGLEIELLWIINDRLKFAGNLSWLDAKLPLSNEDKAQVPGVMAFAELAYQVSENWSISGQSYLIKDRKRQASDTRTPVPDYHKLDLTANWRSDYGLSAQIGIRNLFNEEIKEPSPQSGLFALGLGFPDDYPMESRSGFISLSYDF